jgi:hypothetical protein
MWCGCQKYRFRILRGEVKASLESGIKAICGFAGCEVVENECASLPCTSGGDGAAEGIDIGVIERGSKPKFSAMVGSKVKSTD